MKIRMEDACRADNTARDKGQPAIHKLKMLPEVVALLNRNTIQHSIVDPDTNFLLSVRFFLEPLSDGSLPAYNIQRDLFAALTRLPIEKEALLSSGIGKVVLYYTKSKKPEIGIKRTAERLLGEWSRPILKRSDDYKKRKVMSKEFDHQYVSQPIRRKSNSTNKLLQSRPACHPFLGHTTIPTRTLTTRSALPAGTPTRTLPRPTQPQQPRENGDVQLKLHHRPAINLRPQPRPRRQLETHRRKRHGSIQENDSQAGQEEILMIEQVVAVVSVGVSSSSRYINFTL